MQRACRSGNNYAAQQAARSAWHCCIAGVLAMGLSLRLGTALAARYTIKQLRTVQHDLGRTLGCRPAELVKEPDKRSRVAAPCYCERWWRVTNVSERAHCSQPCLPQPTSAGHQRLTTSASAAGGDRYGRADTTALARLQGHSPPMLQRQRPAALLGRASASLNGVTVLLVQGQWPHPVALPQHASQTGLRVGC